MPGRSYIGLLRSDLRRPVPKPSTTRFLQTRSVARRSQTRSRGSRSSAVCRTRRKCSCPAPRLTHRPRPSSSRDHRPGSNTTTQTASSRSTRRRRRTGCRRHAHSRWVPKYLQAAKGPKARAIHPARGYRLGRRPSRTCRARSARRTAMAESIQTAKTEIKPMGIMESKLIVPRAYCVARQFAYYEVGEGPKARPGCPYDIGNDLT